MKNKKGKYGVKMEPLKFGDLRYWGSDLFDRLEQQVYCRDRAAPERNLYHHEALLWFVLSSCLPVRSKRDRLVFVCVRIGCRNHFCYVFEQVNLG